MKRALSYKLIVALLPVLFFCQVSFAQFEEGIDETLFGMPKMQGLRLDSTPSNTVTYSALGAPLRSIKNIITFSMREDSMYFASGFSATVHFTVQSKEFLASSPVTTADSLTINYDTTTGAKYTVRSYKVLPQAEEVTLTVNSISVTGQSGWDPTVVLKLENEMRILRYYDLSSNPTYLAPTFGTPVDDTDAVGVSWSWGTDPHNNMSQLEWAWVETEMAPFYSSLDELFKNNSTRVDLDHLYNSYKIPLLYDGVGKLYYRVRPALRRNDGAIITGPWSVPDSFSFAGHEPDLNWQSSTSFAENGKFKSVIQYFDGSLRNRQTVTKDNTTGNTIVSETIYDLQGRPNIQILPTPTIDNRIKYFTNFNQFNGQASNQDPAQFFDLTPAAVQCDSTAALNSMYGNAKYYSNQNPWLSTEVKSKYIPDAEGYAFTETRYMDDATERVRSQGGVGKFHQINSGHETKYYYGKPAQPEIDALFGTEVGDASHYTKNMVQDANGQKSISYVDMHGRTIATALAGDPTPGIDSIINNSDYPQASGQLTNQLLTPQTNIIQGNSIEAINSILVTSNGNYEFTYKLDPAILSQISCDAHQICFDCKYDLEISIKSEECGVDTPMIRRYQNLSIVPAVNACSLSMGFSGPDADSITKQIRFTQFLTTGSYVIRKTLTINDSLFQIRRDSALKVFLCRSEHDIYDSIVSILYTTSGCGLAPGSTTVCDSCLSHLGTFNAYRVHYLLSIGADTTNTSYDAQIHVQYRQDSIQCVQACSPFAPQMATLAVLRTQMLTDMVPFTGQYAIDSLRDSLGVVLGPVVSTRTEARYNIITTVPAVSGLTKPFYKYPRDENGISSIYNTEMGQPDLTIYPNGSADHTFLLGISKDDFSNLFKRSWANSLIYYHPEFCKLKYAEDTLHTSYEWLDKVLQCDTYQKAHDSDYIHPLLTDPYFVNGYVPADSNTMKQYLFHYISDPAGPSIWQIANGMVLCDSLPPSIAGPCMLAKDSTGVQSGTTTSQKDLIWEKFRTVYLSYRNEMVTKHINAHKASVLSQATMDSLQTEKKLLRFATAQDMADQSGWTWWAGMSASGDTTGTGIYTTTTANIDYCAGQRTYWKNRLNECEVLMGWLDTHTHSDSLRVDTVINTILDSMVLVCRHSTTALQIYGASNVNPTYTGNPRNFESIINTVFSAHGIATLPGDNYFCNPYTIDFPKPFGLNPPLIVNHTNVLDSCACKRFKVLKDEAGQHGVDTLSLDSMNVYLNANYHDSLTLALWQGLARCGEMFRDSCNTFPADSIRCPDPEITSVHYNHSLGRMQLTYAPHPQFTNCSIAVYDDTRALIRNLSVSCGDSSINIDSLDQCHNYVFVFKASSDSCGDLYSDTAYYDGACQKPVILSAQFLRDGSTMHITYSPHPCYKACVIHVYDKFNAVVLTTEIVCADSSINIDSLNQCQDYSFVIEANGDKCENIVSDTFYYHGACRKPKIISVIYGPSEPVIHVKYEPNPCYSNCRLFAYDKESNLVVDQTIDCADSSIYLSIDPPCQKLRFWINSSAEECGDIVSDTVVYAGCCIKPVITNIYTPHTEEGGIVVNYHPLPDCENCILYVYDNDVKVWSDTLHCEDSSVLVNFDMHECRTYSFLIKCKTDLCPNNVSDTVYYNPCCTKPVITHIGINKDEKDRFVVYYASHLDCRTCILYVYDERDILVWSDHISCADSVVVDSTLGCGKYAFVIKCNLESCPNNFSDTVYYDLYCCPKPIINSITSTEEGIHIAYQSQPDYTGCDLMVYDEDNNLIVDQPIGCDESATDVTGLTDCHNYAFVIQSSSDRCRNVLSDTVYYNPCCPKPTITHTEFIGGVLHVTYLSEPPYDDCQLRVYDNHYHLVWYGTIHCDSTAINISGLDSCKKYNFQIVSSSIVCGMVHSDLTHHGGCERMVTICHTVYTPITLSSFVIMPAILNCDYHKPCITCGRLDTLTTEFQGIFPAYSSAPYLDSTTTSEQGRQNGLWARFLNYRTGFSKTAIDYLVAYHNCNVPSPVSPTTTAICSFTPAANDPSGVPNDIGPCTYVQNQALFMAQMLYQQMKDSLISRFDSLYKAKCFLAKYNEHFYVRYQPKEYHFTLYYYDQGGNLVKTIPPAAVRPNYDSLYTDSVDVARNGGTDKINQNIELLATQYRYNTLNQVIAQKTPDAAVSTFWYDRLGRLVVSQNANQFPHNDYSYTLYDSLGRITEVGQGTNATTMTQAISQSESSLSGWVSAADKKQITLTVYDIPYTSIRDSIPTLSALYQKNLRNRVSYSMVFDDENQEMPLSDGTIAGGNSATYYSYDIHGNVDTLLQDYNIGMGDIACTSDSGNRFKRMVYDYDLISGKVNDVAYQPGQPDQFYHHYDYDAENRLTEVHTSRDKIYWERDAMYEYYRHGPLARTVLGKNQVQGLDYAYTIQGWLKGVNCTSVGNTLYNGGDLGHDGLAGDNINIARDAFGFSLNYFTGDYKPISGSVNPFVTVPMSLPPDPATGISTGSELFNGNIGAMVVNIPKLGAPMVYGYRYDQLNRITRMDAFNGLVNATNVFTPVRTDDYHEQATYDPNGNIRTYTRHGAAAIGNLQMDSLTYHYDSTHITHVQANNRLRYVTDEVSTHADDIGTQAAGNYTYDAIGNLIADSTEGIDSIKWTVYGKIKDIYKRGDTSIHYTYDAAGSRISKTVTTTGGSKSTYYVRDASGDVMSVYQNGIPSINSGDLTQIEIDLYGSSRLGVNNVKTDMQCWEGMPETTNFIRGNKFFELSNHLGNVLATVSDKNNGHDSGHDTTDYYTADIVTAGDYYPFGMQMPGRKFSQTNSSYRYSINGQEKESDLNENITTTEYWEYDSRIGRRWNVDPIYKENESPYATFGNNPIWNVDPDGSDTAKYISNDQMRDAAKIASAEIKSRTDKKEGFGLQSKNYLKALNPAAAAYAEKNKLSNEQTFEFYNNVLRYYDGLCAVAMSSPKMFEQMNTLLLNNPSVNSKFALTFTQKGIQESRSNLLGLLTLSANVALGEAVGSIGTSVGAKPRIPLQSSGLATTQRVGQWMTPQEYETFNETGTIPRSNVLTRGPAGYEKQASLGDFYVEFDVNKTLLRNKSSNGNGWALIKSKNQMEIKLAAKRGQTLPNPVGTNIKMVKSKQ